MIGLYPLAAYDAQSDIVFKEIKIDREGTLSMLKDACMKALALAVSIAYCCKETIGFILAKAAAHAKALEKHIKTEQSATAGKKAEDQEESSEEKEGKENNAGKEAEVKEKIEEETNKSNENKEENKGTAEENETNKNQEQGKD